jgi:hypothetical protein
MAGSIGQFYRLHGGSPGQHTSINYTFLTVIMFAASFLCFLQVAWRAAFSRSASCARQHAIMALHHGCVKVLTWTTYKLKVRMLPTSCSKTHGLTVTVNASSLARNATFSSPAHLA